MTSADLEAARNARNMTRRGLSALIAAGLAFAASVVEMKCHPVGFAVASGIYDSVPSFAGCAPLSHESAYSAASGLNLGQAYAVEIVERCPSSWGIEATYASQADRSALEAVLSQVATWNECEGWGRVIASKQRSRS